MKKRAAFLILGLVVVAGAVPPLALWYYDGPRGGRTSDGRYSVFMRHEGEVALEFSSYPPSAEPTVSQLRNATALVGGAIAAQTKFQDFSVATTTLGYTVSNFKILNRPSARFYHVWNPNYMRDSIELDPEHPEALVYYNSVNDQKKELVGLMFMAKPGVHGAQPGGNLTRWHVHQVVEFCQDSNGIPTVAAEHGVKGGCPAGMTNGPTPEMMHVWLVDNPFGAFSHRMALPGEQHAEHNSGNTYTAFAVRGARFAASMMGIDLGGNETIPGAHDMPGMQHTARAGALPEDSLPTPNEGAAMQSQRAPSTTDHAHMSTKTDDIPHEAAHAHEKT